MKETGRRVATSVSQEEIFKAVIYGALKARAGHLPPGEIIRIGRFEMLVVEDEVGEGVAVQIIEERKSLEDLALSRAHELGLTVAEWSDEERASWMEFFFLHLQERLSKWEKIKIRKGPGESLTIEKDI